MSVPYVPRTEDMRPRHGFVSGLFGRLTRSLVSGGSGRWVTDWTVAFCGLGTMVGSASGWDGHCVCLDRMGGGGGREVSRSCDARVESGVGAVKKVPQAQTA